MTQIFLEDNMLECAVCLETFDETCKMLPCQHTFCKKCLECIYENEQCLHCPECRLLVNTEIDRLPRNFFLLNIIEKIKVSKPKADVYLASNESLQLQFALIKSEEESLLKDEERNLRKQKEKLEFELTLLKSNLQSELELPGVGLDYYSFESSEKIAAENDNVSMGISESEFQPEIVDSPNDKLMKQILDEFNNLNIIGASEDGKTTSPDLHQLWNDVTNVLAVVSDERLFNNLKFEDLDRYNGIIGNYLSALFDYYRKTCISDDDEFYDCIARASQVPTVSLTSSTSISDLNNGYIEINTNNTSDEEKKNFAYASLVSRQAFVTSDEESLFELILKKSEVTDSIDKHKKNIQILKEKIEFKMALMMSEN